MNHAPASFAVKFDVAHLQMLADAYQYADDHEVEHVIAPAAKQRGHFTKDEFQRLCRWKTARSRSRVASNPAALVEEVTRIALSTPDEELRIRVLTLLKGVSWPTASVVLHFAHREQYPILDFRALWSLGSEPPSQYTFEFWSSYVRFCRELAVKTGVSMRTLDRALWQYSKTKQPGEATMSFCVNPAGSTASVRNVSLNAGNQT